MLNQLHIQICRKWCVLPTTPSLATGFDTFKTDQFSQCLHDVASNPTLVRSICEEAKTSRFEGTSISKPGQSCSSTETDTFIGIACSCRPYRATRRSSRRVGDSMLFRVSESLYSHHKNCRFFLPSSKSSSVGINIFLGWLFSRAVRISCTISGHSISPQLSLRNVVSNSAPAFQLLLSKGGIFQEPSIRNAEATLRELGTMFQSGKANPTDVMEDGRTLIHYVCCFVRLCTDLTG